MPELVVSQGCRIILLFPCSACFCRREQSTCSSKKNHHQAPSLDCLFVSMSTTLVLNGEQDLSMFGSASSSCPARDPSYTIEGFRFLGEVKGLIAKSSNGSSEILRETVTSGQLLHAHLEQYLYRKLDFLAKHTNFKFVRCPYTYTQHRGWRQVPNMTAGVIFRCRIRELRTLVLLVLTSFISSTFLPTGPPDPVRATAFLDGLRGVVAFVVYCHHVSQWFW